MSFLPSAFLNRTAGLTAWSRVALLASEPRGPFLHHMFCLLLFYVSPRGSSQVLGFARQAAGRLSCLISQAWKTNSLSSNLISPKECADQLNFVPFCHVFLVLVSLWMPCDDLFSSHYLPTLQFLPVEDAAQWNWKPKFLP